MRRRLSGRKKGLVMQTPTPGRAELIRPSDGAKSLCYVFLASLARLGFACLFDLDADAIAVEEFFRLDFVFVDAGHGNSLSSLMVFFLRVLGIVTL